MRLFVCDRCGVQGTDKKRLWTQGDSPLVKVVTVRMEPMSRTVDLCGDCRTALMRSLDEFLAVHPSSGKDKP